MIDHNTDDQIPPDDCDLQQERKELELSRPSWWESGAIQQVPFVGPFIAEYQKAMWQAEADRFFFRANQRALDRVVLTLEEIRSRVEQSAEEVVNRLNEDERLADLLNQALRAAARSGFESKRRALATVLANAIGDKDDARVDEAELLVAALSQVEAAHVRVIGLFHEVDPFESKKLTVDGLKLTHPELSGSVEALVLQLFGWGLVKTEPRRFLDGRDGPQRYVTPSDFQRANDYRLTDLGVQVCRLLLADETPHEFEGRADARLREDDSPNLTT